MEKVEPQQEHKMTLVEALEKMILVWEQLAKNPYATKDEVYLELGISSDLNHCSCCEFASYGTPGGRAIDCNNCPMYLLWPHGCSKHDTPYGVWCRSYGTSRATKAAAEIVQGAKNKLQELI